MIKAIKVLILSLALALGGGGMWVTAGYYSATELISTVHNVGTPPLRASRITVNMCNGAAVKYVKPWVYGVTADHCIKAPMDRVMVDVGENWEIGELMRTDGDIAYIRWQGPKPEILLPFAKELPKPGDVVWVAAEINGDYLPIPGVWLGTKMELGNISALAMYGSVSKGFSGSPVINHKGEIFGIISLGSFIDSHDSESIIAPWAGVSVFEHLR